MKKMEYSPDYLKSLEGKIVGIRFSDGCFVEVRIVSADHVKEGDDILGQVQSVLRNEKNQKHKKGCFINFRGSDIAEIVILK